MKQFYRKQFSNYLGEQRAILDIVIGFTPNPSQTPTPSTTATLTPTATPTGTLFTTPTPTATNTPTPSITASQTPTNTPTPTNTGTATPTPTNTKTPTPTRTGTPTPTATPTPTTSPAVPYQSALLEVECLGGVLIGGDQVTVDGTPYPLTVSGGTIGVAGCVNVLIRNNTSIIYNMFYGPNSQVCLTPGNTYDSVRLINFQYNPAIGLFGGYDYTEQLYMGPTLVGGSVKQTAIVNPPADLGNGCPTQDLDLVVTFYVETIGVTPTPTSTLPVTPTPTTTSTNTPTPTTTSTNTPTPTPTNTGTPAVTPTNTSTPTPTPTVPPPVQYVSMGLGTDKLTYSYDGTNFFASSNGNSIITGTSQGRVRFDNDIWIAGYGSNYKVAYSTDGITWTNSGNGNTIFGSTSIVTDLAYGNGTWVGTSEGANKIGYSTNNGITWSNSSNGNVSIGDAYGVTFDGTKFIAVGDTGGVNSIASSYDGITWTGNSALNGVMDNLRTIAYGGGKLIVGNRNTGQPAIAYSTNNGTTWTTVAGTPLNTVVDIFFNGSVWVAVGDNSSVNQSIMISTDGITWSLPSVGSNIFSTQGQTVTFSNNRWLAGGQSTTFDMATSTDNGDTWTGINATLQTTIVKSIAARTEYYLLAENGSYIQTESSDDINIEN